MSPTPQSAMSQVIQKTNNEQSRRWNKQPDSTVKNTKLDFVARGRGEVAEQLLLCNEAAQVPRTTPTETRDNTKALSGNH